MNVNFVVRISCLVFFGKVVIISMVCLMSICYSDLLMHCSIPFGELIVMKKIKEHFHIMGV